MEKGASRNLLSETSKDLLTGSVQSELGFHEGEKSSDEKSGSSTNKTGRIPYWRKKNNPVKIKSTTRTNIGNG